MTKELLTQSKKTKSFLFWKAKKEALEAVRNLKKLYAKTRS